MVVVSLTEGVRLVRVEIVAPRVALPLVESVSEWFWAFTVERRLRAPAPVLVRKVFAVSVTGSAKFWARMAQVALAKKDSGDPFYTAKLHTARFYFAKLLPETAGLIRSARAGLAPLMAMEEAMF